MKNILYILIGALLNFGCVHKPASNVTEAKPTFEMLDSLAKNPVKEGYEPEQKIDFSHSTHSQINALNDCKKCHVASGKKVELNMCSNCHINNVNERLNLTYYERLDSISAYIKKRTNTPNTK